MDLAKLNKVQAEAVQCIDAPTLIFAGAGSGKTRVLTQKIAYLIAEAGYAPENILAVTFTNKAANEMQLRVEKLLSELGISKAPQVIGSAYSLEARSGHIHVGTFHSICARLLRREIQHLGYSNDFTIYDADDQSRLIKSILDTRNIDTQIYPPNQFRSVISKAKSKLQTPDDLEAIARKDYDQTVAQIYRDYQVSLKRNHALDFDDLLILPLQLFEEYPHILQKYQAIFKYILVDEYQDTNKAQFKFIKYLAGDHQAITVVGDDDQSIYSWRGADISNILNFNSTFKNAEVFKLEQNYRSSNVILEAATAIVSRNSRRTPKNLWTERTNGDLISIYEAENERIEAEQIIKQIQHEVLLKKRRFKDMVILYRTNAQSRALEDALRRMSISYTIVGGTKFYDRKEVKDVLAYLRILVNQDDTVSLERVINFPPRSIGETSLTKIKEYAGAAGIGLFAGLDQATEAGIQPKQSQSMAEFKELIERYRQLLAGKSEHIKQEVVVSEYTGNGDIDGTSVVGMSELITALLEECGIADYYKRQNNSDASERLDNIEELITSIDQYQQDNPGAGLRDFLVDVSLLTDVDRWNSDSNAVTLMTLHSAKGLEFPVVFISGLEEGLFPIIRPLDNDHDEEEERRLFYVGITRAEEKAYLSYARNRRRYGSDNTQSVASSFIREIPESLVEAYQKREPAFVGDGEITKTFKRAPLKADRAFARKSVMDDYVVGAWVEHKIFGKGQIAAREGVGDNLKLKIQFTGGEEKKLVARYANLVRL
ncbi:ATP-dependent helicase [Candidatus Neomarinimicrobiota bacterium]